jgi:ubiquinone/menaquinone biosynthesis C-methylase UbiE
VRRALLGAAAAWFILRAWGALRPTAFPYFARSILDIPRPLITRRRLLEALDPAQGERILEIGPGTGYYTIPVAGRVGTRGSLEILDVRENYLRHSVERARRNGLSNVVARRGDGGSLPDATFDGAYLISVLGEIPDPEAALVELRRVLKPSGRLVLGEIFIDPDFPRLGWLVKHARDAGLRLERRSGGALAYYATFRPSGD